MFKHNLDQAKTNADAKPDPVLPNNLPDHPPDSAPEALRALMEKNLKWSQILYEQNRRINNKLFWAAVSSWIRTGLVAIPLILALWFLPAFYQQWRLKFGPFLDHISPQNTASPAQTLEDALKFLPLSAAERERLKTMFK